MLHKQAPVEPKDMIPDRKYIAQPKNGKPPSKPMKLKELNSEGNPIFSNVPGLNSVFGAGKFNFYGYYDPATGYNAANDPLGDNFLDAAGIAAKTGFNLGKLRHVHPVGFRRGDVGALEHSFKNYLPEALAARALGREDLEVDLLHTNDGSNPPSYYRYTIHGCTQLIKAAVQGDDVRVRKLLEWGADNEEMDADEISTPLMWAVEAGKIRCIHDLLRLPGGSGKKANINAESKKRQTPLRIAIRLNNVELVKVLLDYGADLRNVDFPSVCAKSSLELITLLLNSNLRIDLNVMDYKGRNGLMFAIGQSKKNPSRINVVRLLLERGADPKLKNDHGENAYSIARAYNNPAIIALLGKANINRNRDERGIDSDMNADNNATSVTHSQV